MAAAGVLVDVDGTLVDSNYHHTLAWSRAFRDRGRHVPLAVIHRLVGMGGEELLQTLGITDDREAITSSWRSHFDALLPEVVPFEGAQELLRAIHATGLTVVLATSSPPDLLAVLRERIGADDVIDDTVTNDDVDQAKPAPDIFRVGLRKASLDPADAVALGDSLWDVQAASRASLACVGLECGGTSRLELEAAGADGVFANPVDLLEQLGASRIGTLASTLGTRAR
jgi:HAD superfamily hydrolase (TIGR01509 family)